MNLETNSAYWQLKKQQKAIETDTNDVTQVLSLLLRDDAKFKMMLERIVLNNHQEDIRAIDDLESVKASLELVQNNLQLLIRKRLERMAQEIKTPFIKQRTVLEQQIFVEKKQEILDSQICMFTLEESFPSKSYQYLKPCLYDDLDLFDSLKAICKAEETIWSVLSVSVNTSSYEELQLKFVELHPSNQPTLSKNHRCSESLEGLLEDKVLQNQVSLEQLQEHCIRGLFPSVRPMVWRQLVETESVICWETHVKRTTYTLTQKIIKASFMIDRLLQLESKHSQNDDHYFVFEEIIRDVLLFWSRDDWIPQKRLSLPNTEKVNCVLPIWGVSLSVMPLCYLYDTPEELYMVFRQLYVKYFYHLHHPTTQLVKLCVLFETLVKEHDMDLWMYLVQDLHIQPLEIAFKWIIYAFVGILESDQVLMLWDRIIGYDSLELLSVTAAALFSFRKSTLMYCQHRQEAIVFQID